MNKKRRKNKWQWRIRNKTIGEKVKKTWRRKISKESDGYRKYLGRG